MKRIVETVRRTPKWLYAATLWPAILIVVAAGLQPWVPQTALFKDPLYLTGGEPYFGLVSYVGVVLMIGASVSCLFSMSLWSGRRDQRFWFLAAGGVLSGLLAIDDLFLLHELVYPTIFGIPETVTFFTYGLLVIGYVVRFRSTISQQEPALLALALLFLFLSMSFDKATGPRAIDIADGMPGGAVIVAILEFIAPAATILDDGPKLVGLSAWTGFHVRAAWEIAKTPRLT